MTHGEVIILGLLCTRDRYGYEMEKHIEENYMREWTQIGFSSIYNILNKLTEKELIGYRYTDRSGGPQRKVYYILEKGREAVKDEVLKMLSVPTMPKSDLDVGIVFSILLDKDAVRDSLIRHREKLNDTIAWYEKLLVMRYKDKPTVVLLFKRAIMQMHTDIRWIDEIMKEG